MHYAFLVSIVVAALLGAAAMSVVHAEEAPATHELQPHPPLIQPSAASALPTAPRAMEISTESADDHEPASRESYYGQGFESRGINVEKLPRGGTVFGHPPAH